MTPEQTLDRIAVEHGIEVVRETFDGGTAVVARVARRVLVTATAEHGDVDPNTTAAEHLRRLVHLDEALAFRAAQKGQVAAIQRLIDGGTWGLEGSVGRMMARAIEDGDCILGNRSARDYWGTFIPAHWMVADGTKGSVAYAIAQQDER